VIDKEKHSLRVNVSYNNENLVVSSGGAPKYNAGGFSFFGAFVKEGEPLGFLRGASSSEDENGVATINRNINIGNTFSPNSGSFSLNYTYDNKLSFLLNGDYQTGVQAGAVDDVLRFFGGLRDEDRFPTEIQDYNAIVEQSLSFFDLANYWVEDSDFF
jgi:hypothetical protein